MARHSAKSLADCSVISGATYISRHGALPIPLTAKLFCTICIGIVSGLSNAGSEEHLFQEVLAFSASTFDFHGILPMA